MITRADILLTRALADKRARNEHRLFVAEGRKLIGEIVQAGWTVRRLFEDPAELSRLSLLKTAPDALAWVEIPVEKPLPSAERQLILALDGVQNPGNLGTLIRLADWFGIDHLVCSDDTADCYNPKVVQATMGAITRVAVHYTALDTWLKQQRGEIFGTFMTGESLFDAELSAHGVVVLGNEGQGIRPAVEALCTRRITIPKMREKAESLNVATAGAIICAEFARVKTKFRIFGL